MIFHLPAQVGTRASLILAGTAKGTPVVAELLRLKRAVVAHWLPTGEASLQVMPEEDLWFSELPAQIDLATIQDSRKINEPLATAFRFDAQRAKLFNILFQLLHVFVHLSLDLDQFFMIRVPIRLCLASQKKGQALSALGYVARKTNQVGNDSAYERQRRVGLFGRKYSPPGRALLQSLAGIH
jgi:hypothetical protein